MTLTLMGATMMLLEGCAGSQGMGSTISYTVVGLWLGGASLLGLLSGCGISGGSGGAWGLSRSSPKRPPMPLFTLCRLPPPRRP
jgi:hypothetical protein